MRISILTTGYTELYGIGPALQGLFPEHEFEVVRFRNDEPFDSFTSSRLSASAAPRQARALVEAAAREAVGDRHRRASDLVIILDDLELENVDQPQVPVGIIRDAVRTHLSRLDGEQDIRIVARTRRALRERVSFHLVKPMIEAWILADPCGPARAGVPRDRSASPNRHDDRENFEVRDEAYDAASAADCEWFRGLSEAEQRKSENRPPWLGQLPRHRHPKYYLSWLCRDGSVKKCSTYRETLNGAAALRQLDWSGLLASEASAPFARALVNDIADLVGSPEPFPGEVSEFTARSGALDALLRNV